MGGVRFKARTGQPGGPGVCLFPVALLFCLGTVSSSRVLGGCPVVLSFWRHLRETKYFSVEGCWGRSAVRAMETAPEDWAE